MKENTWSIESKRYTERMQKAYHLTEEFDKNAFKNDPVGYFQSINYNIQGTDWIPAIWNLIKLAKTDSSFIKGQYGPNGQKVKQIINILISKNKELKDGVEKAEAKIPSLLNKYGKNLENVLLKEAKIQDKKRLQEGISSGIRKGIIFLILALITVGSLAASSYTSQLSKGSNLATQSIERHSDELNKAISIIQKVVDYTKNYDDRVLNFCKDQGFLPANNLQDFKVEELNNSNDYKEIVKELASDFIYCVDKNFDGDMDKAISYLEKALTQASKNATPRQVNFDGMGPDPSKNASSDENIEVSRNQGVVRGSTVANLSNIAWKIASTLHNGGGNNILEIAQRYNLSTQKLSTESNTHNMIKALLKAMVVADKLTQADIQNICAEMGIQYNT